MEHSLHVRSLAAAAQGSGLTCGLCCMSFFMSLSPRSCRFSAVSIKSLKKNKKNISKHHIHGILKDFLAPRLFYIFYIVYIDYINQTPHALWSNYVNKPSFKLRTFSHFSKQLCAAWGAGNIAQIFMDENLLNTISIHTCHVFVLENTCNINTYERAEWCSGRLLGP